MEIIMRDSFINSINEYDEIYIYGAGLYANMAYDLLKETGMNYKVKSFIVTNSTNESSDIDDVKIISVRDIDKSVLSKTTILIAVSMRYCDEIVSTLNEYNIGNVIRMTDYVMNDTEITKILKDNLKNYTNEIYVCDSLGLKDNDVIRKLKLIRQRDKALRIIEGNHDIFVNNRILNSWEQNLLTIEKEYKEICIYWLYTNRIGELIVRFSVIMEDIKGRKEQGILDLFVCEDTENVNHALLEIGKRKIAILDEKTRDFWLYILKNYSGKINTEKWEHYACDRSKFGTKVITSKSTVEWMKLTEEENLIGETKKNYMGIRKPFICISNRESTYLNMTKKYMDTTYHDFEDSHIEKFKLMAGYMEDKNIQLVRMGQYYKQKVEFDNCIDYAINYHDDLMDLVLYRDCKFCIGTKSGILLMGSAFATPCVILNMVPIGRGGMGPYPRWGEENLLIFKKYYSLDLGRFLTLREMLIVDNTIAKWDGHEYEKMNIRFEENTEEEILDVAIEMNDRIDGVWVETEDNRIRQQKFWNIMNEHYNNTPDVPRYMTFFCTIGARFLEKNEFLLDDKVEWSSSVVSKNYKEI